MFHTRKNKAVKLLSRCTSWKYRCLKDTDRFLDDCYKNGLLKEIRAVEEYGWIYFWGWHQAGKPCSSITDTVLGWLHHKSVLVKGMCLYLIFNSKGKKEYAPALWGDFVVLRSLLNCLTQMTFHKSHRSP